VTATRPRLYLVPPPGPGRPAADPQPGFDPTGYLAGVCCATVAALVHRSGRLQRTCTQRPQRCGSCVHCYLSAAAAELGTAPSGVDLADVADAACAACESEHLHTRPPGDVDVAVDLLHATARDLFDRALPTTVQVATTRCGPWPLAPVGARPRPVLVQVATDG
jgi:hypothetical protein